MRGIFCRFFGRFLCMYVSLDERLPPAPSLDIEYSVFCSQQIAARRYSILRCSYSLSQYGISRPARSPYFSQQPSKPPYSFYRHEQGGERGRRGHICPEADGQHLQEPPGLRQERPHPHRGQPDQQRYPEIVVAIVVDFVYPALFYCFSMCCWCCCYCCCCVQCCVCVQAIPLVLVWPWTAWTCPRTWPSTPTWPRSHAPSTRW